MKLCRKHNIIFYQKMNLLDFPSKKNQNFNALLFGYLEM